MKTPTFLPDHSSMMISREGDASPRRNEEGELRSVNHVQSPPHLTSPV